MAIRSVFGDRSRIAALLVSSVLLNSWQLEQTWLSDAWFHRLDADAEVLGGPVDRGGYVFSR